MGPQQEGEFPPLKLGRSSFKSENEREERAAMGGRGLQKSVLQITPPNSPHPCHHQESLDQNSET